MIAVEILIEKLNNTTRKALESASSLTIARNNHELDIEHLLLKIVEQENNDVSFILDYYKVDKAKLNKDIINALDRLKRGNNRSVSFGLNLYYLLKEACLVSSLVDKDGPIRTGHLLLGMLNSEKLLLVVREISREIEKISFEQISSKFNEITSQSIEALSISVNPTIHSTNDTAKSPSITKALDQFTIDLTEKARQSTIDPVLGRDSEIRHVIHVLTRRRQNNPILTGEPGVGKTAIVEGLALRIISGDVPAPLKNVSIRVLDLGLLQAGASVKGEFENRLKSVIEEVKASPQPIILFIDEAHTLIGAGAEAGHGDAANLLKPALSRGELRTIAATTFAEYKQHFEQDAALARRFQVVQVEEPSESMSTIILRGLRANLEQHHKVLILDEALEAAARLSNRYITGRQLPDKAISVLDTACAQVALSHAAIPSSLEHIQRTLEILATEISILERENAMGGEHNDRISELRAQETIQTENFAQLELRWQQEKELVVEIQQLQISIEEALRREPSMQKVVAHANGGDSVSIKGNSSNSSAEMRSRLQQLNHELQQLQGESPLVFPCVNAQTIAQIIADWTGIPVGKMAKSEVSNILNLQAHMERRVIGQSHALERIVRRIETSKANLADPNSPIGVFLLLGPSGVGKTETAHTLADILYGGSHSLIKLSMTEYKEAHTVSKLKGSPPGYVGYKQGGILTEAVRRKPYSVVLLDEIDQAHKDVRALFYEVFDKGEMEDSEGRKINFRNTVILLTSNVGTNTIMEVFDKCNGNEPDTDEVVEQLNEDLLSVFPPALLGRMVVIPYYPLSSGMITKITKLQLDKVVERVKEVYNALLTYDNSVIENLVAHCMEVDSGARNIKKILTDTVLPTIARDFLTHMSNQQSVTSAHISAEGEILYQYQ